MDSLIQPFSSPLFKAGKDLSKEATKRSDQRTTFFEKAPQQKMTSLQSFLDLISKGSKAGFLQKSDGLIYFNHFTKLYSPPTLEDVKKLFMRGAAAILPKDHHGADLMIPYLLPAKENESSSSSCVTLKDDNGTSRSYTFGLLVIQVKNTGSLKSPTKIFNKLMPSYVWDRTPDKRLENLPTIGVAFSLRSKDSKDLRVSPDGRSVLVWDFDHMILPADKSDGNRWQSMRERIYDLFVDILLEDTLFTYSPKLMKRSWGPFFPHLQEDESVEVEVEGKDKDKDKDKE
jgi:hypothetical protein